VFGRRISVLAIAGALLLPVVSECLISVTADAHTMQCCAQSTCAPGHQKQTCVSTPAPGDSARMAPEARTPLAPPSVTVDAHPSTIALVVVAFSSPSVADAPQHSPPKLYTLNVALLI
jgi:hypothetical protein